MRNFCHTLAQSMKINPPSTPNYMFVKKKEDIFHLLAEILQQNRVLFPKLKSTTTVKLLWNTDVFRMLFATSLCILLQHRKGEQILSVLINANKAFTKKCQRNLKTLNTHSRDVIYWHLRNIIAIQSIFGIVVTSLLRSLRGENGAVFPIKNKWPTISKKETEMWPVCDKIGD